MSTSPPATDSVDQNKNDKISNSSTPTLAASGASPLQPETGELSPAQIERARQEAEWKASLSRLEYEIETLRTVLSAKQTQAADLKRKLGITPIVEIKQDLEYGLKTIKESDAYQKTGTALKSFSEYASKKLTDIRNSNTFKSMEERVGTAYQSTKATGGQAAESTSYVDTVGDLPKSASANSAVNSSTAQAGTNEKKTNSQAAENPTTASTSESKTKDESSNEK